MSVLEDDLVAGPVVVLAEELATRLRRDEFDIEVRHRDVQRPDPR